MRLFGGVVPFIGWRKYQMTVTDMKEELHYLLKEYPDLKDTPMIEDLTYGIKNADIFVFETFEVEFLEFKLIQFIRKKFFIRFEVAE